MKGRINVPLSFDLAYDRASCGRPLQCHGPDFRPASGQGRYYKASLFMIYECLANLDPITPRRALLLTISNFFSPHFPGPRFAIQHIMTVSQPKMKEERKRHTKPCRFFQTGTCPLSAAHLHNSADFMTLATVGTEIAVDLGMIPSIIYQSQLIPIGSMLLLYLTRAIYLLNIFLLMGGAPVVEDPLNKPECIVVPVDHCAGSTLFIGSSGIPKAQLQNIQTTSDDNSSKLHSNVERKPYKTVRCKFHKPPKRLCPKGDDCTFIHSNPVPLLPSKDSSQASSGSEKTTGPSIKITSESKPRSPEHALPSKPLTHIEAERQKGYFAVTWRVISGGVQMGVNKPDSEITLEHDTKTTDYKHEASMALPSMFSAVASVCRARSPAQSLDYSHSARVYKPPRKRTISNPSRVPPVLDSIGVYPAESP
ncbi:hypothetical protein LENED_003893 [Lentinula edodes]|uniref:C3H1-type domain-containing protein n=1 Tax=Lentinula edodes TaxID=5353 RepID=A0A1Q3E577_LENED|nr:hypothetical protein LENED_003893 [Lentinula edodes]